jgi:integrase
MRAKVVLLARVKTEDGKYPFVPVEIKKGRPTPIGDTIINKKGRRIPVEDATAYYLRYTQNGARVVEPVGVNIDQAFVAYQNKEMSFARARIGLAPAPETSEVVQGRTRIADAVTKYVGQLEASVTTDEYSKATLTAYRNAIEDFRDNCGVQYISEINGDILSVYKIQLFGRIKKRAYGNKINTVANRFRYLSVFLRKNGIKLTRAKNPESNDKGLMGWSDVPREAKKEHINKYSEDEINAMLSVADVDEADFIQTFLRTGCRDEEIVYLHWTDVDFKRRQIVISKKPKYGWRPKDREARTIPLEDGVLLKRLAARKERQRPPSPLVFPNTNNEPDMHLIRRLHKVGEKAKAAKFEFEGDLTLHRFRRTYASMMISHCDLQTVSELLGHSDIQTTARYLAPDNTKARIGTRTAFKSIGD